ncbi:hypothetical protein HKX48_003697 [Thoreauomyces humboldtii]|nr:hypothetical protein HKX48_003697 [Thoreauomyces humboldtii]
MTVPDPAHPLEGILRDPDLSCTVYLVRHAERIDKVDATWKDTAARPYDSPLTEKGVTQAQASGRLIAKDILTQQSTSSPVHILTSPFLRCIETANGVMSSLISHGLKDATMQLFPPMGFMMKRNFTERPPLDGFTHESRVKEFPGLRLRASTVGYPEALPPFPESPEDQVARYVMSLSQALAEHPEEDHRTVVMVGHGMACSALPEELSSLGFCEPAGLQIEDVPLAGVTKMEKRRGDTFFTAPWLSVVAA